MVELRPTMGRNPPIVAGRPRRPLATGLPYVVALLVAAFTIWFLAMVASWEGKCPSGLQLTGLDKGVYAWPPVPLASSAVRLRYSSIAAC
jgi:hypothetical protein